MNYPFLTLKERDNETGLDYFLARYYSSTQGRFTSPDEFTGGPTELFAEVAAHNPTFYADLTLPPTLNKYQFTVNNPLRFLDPDGHQEVTSDSLLRAAKDAAKDPVGTTIAAGSFVKGYWKGEFKALGNIGIGVNNLGAIAFGHPEGVVQPFDPNGSDAEFMGYKAMSMLTLLSPALSEVGPAGVLTAEAKQTTVISGETANFAAETSNARAATTLRPGPFANESIPARGPQRSFTVSERNAINELGLKSGCQTCGTTNPGTRSGNFIPDHQPPNALNLTNGLQRLFPHCNSCSHRQAGEVTAAKRFNPGGHKF